MALLSSTGSIGTSGANIQTAATNLSANTGGSGNVYLNQSGLVNLTSSSAGALFQLTDNAGITLANALTAPNVSIITTSGSNGNIVVNTNPTVSASLLLNAGGAGNITQGGGVTFNAPTVTLISGTGNIGIPAPAFRRRQRT